MTELGPFILLTFLISLVAFAGIYWIPGAQSPDTARGLPVWLIAVWGPSLAAIILATRTGDLVDLLARAVMLQGVPIAIWILAFSPIIVLMVAIYRSGGLPEPQLLTVVMVCKLVLFNLVLGPTGEELGWRGVMQPALAGKMGWFAASLAVGAVWFVWHLPLWLVDSPQSELPIPLFAAHVMAYAVILGAIVHLTPSIAPAILFHLGVNVMAGVALIGGLGDSTDYFRVTMLPYWVIALAATGWVAIQT